MYIYRVMIMRKISKTLPRERERKGRHQSSLSCFDCIRFVVVCIRLICGFVNLEFLWCGCISLWVVGCVYMMGIL